MTRSARPALLALLLIAISAGLVGASCGNDPGPLDPDDPRAVHIGLDVIGRGAVRADPPLHRGVLRGTRVTLTATPAPRWYFVGWEGLLDGSTNPHRLTAEVSGLVTARFDPLPHPRLNEIVTSSATSLEDEDQDHPDWIELVNTSPHTLDLAGYGLSDRPSEPFRWALPAVSLPGGGHLVVFASGKDRRDPAGPLHTNFSLSRGGETLTLTAPGGEVADQITVPPLATDISYGRQPDGDGPWAYFDRPTPKAPNDSTAYAGITPPPAFSHRGGFYAAPFELSMLSPAPDVTLRYTVDGATPGAASPIFDRRLPITDISTEPDRWTHIKTTPDIDKTGNSMDFWRPPEDPVFKGTVVRARAFREGWIPSPTITRSFFVTPSGGDRYTFPVVSLVTDSDHLFSGATGLFVTGDGYNGRSADTTNFMQRGDDWERPVHVELFEPDGSVGLDQDAGVRVHGGATRRIAWKSVRLYARSRYGDDHLEHAIFPDEPYDAYRRVILRNAGNDRNQTLFRDALIQHLVRGLAFDTQAFRPAVVFWLGEYWGIHNLRERYDAHYIHRVYGIDPEEVDMLANDFRIGMYLVEHGDDVAWQALLDDVEALGADPGRLDAVAARLDLDSTIDFYAVQTWMRNTDSIHNNTRYWRKRVDTTVDGVPHGHDGRFRWLLFDTDFGFWGIGGDAPAHNTLEWMVRPYEDEPVEREWSTFLFRRLIATEPFAHAFINRIADLHNSVFASARVSATADAFEALYRPEIDEHIARHGQPTSVSSWRSRIQNIRRFGRDRWTHMRQHVLDHFGLEGTYPLTVDVAAPGGGTITINRLHIHPATPGVSASPYPFTGTWFTGVPVAVTALPEPGYAFAGWSDDAEAGPTRILTEAPPAPLRATFVEAAHLLSQAPYRFENWSPEAAAGTYPPFMRILQSADLDPDRDATFDLPWTLGYALESRSRVLGLGERGLAFINTSNPQPAAGAGFLGAVELLVDPDGCEGVTVSWTAETVAPNSREYALHLQARTARDAPFANVLGPDGQPVRYRRHPEAGHTEVFADIAIDLPASPEVDGDHGGIAPYLQLRWLYVFNGIQHDTSSGQRTMLRLDDIEVRCVSPLP